MSRFFEFMQKLGAQRLETSSRAAEVPTKSGDARQILSVLHVGPGGAHSKETASGQMEALHFPVEHVSIEPEDRIVTYTDQGSPAADRFRYLRMKLRGPWNAGKLRTLLVTSALPHEGKSTMSLNLATVLAERGKRSVLLIDADLHHSSITQRLGLAGSSGLTNSLKSSTDPLLSVKRIEPLGWNFLPAGDPAAHPTELMHSDALAPALKRVASHFDWVLVDSPPVLPLTDAISVSEHVDATLLVARAGVTSQDAIENAIGLIGRKKVLGLLLNGAEGIDKVYSYYYGDSSRQDQPTPPAEKRAEPPGAPYDFRSNTPPERRTNRAAGNIG